MRSWPPGREKTTLQQSIYRHDSHIKDAQQKELLYDTSAAEPATVDIAVLCVIYSVHV